MMARSAQRHVSVARAGQRLVMRLSRYRGIRTVFKDVLQLGAGCSSRKLSASQPDFGSSGATGSVGAGQSTAPGASGSLSRSSDQMLAASTGADVERILLHPDARKPFQVSHCSWRKIKCDV